MNTSPSASVRYAGRFAEKPDDLDQWSIHPRRLAAAVAERALELLDPLSFPYEAMHPRWFDRPLAVHLDRVAADLVVPLLDRPLLRHLTVFDAVSAADDVWEAIRPRYGLAESQRGTVTDLLDIHDRAVGWLEPSGITTKSDLVVMREAIRDVGPADGATVLARRPEPWAGVVANAHAVELAAPVSVAPTGSVVLVVESDEVPDGQLPAVWSSMASGGLLVMATRFAPRGPGPRDVLDRLLALQDAVLADVRAVRLPTRPIHDRAVLAVRRSGADR